MTTVLVLDDDVLFVDLLSRYLSEHGFDVIKDHSANAAIETLRRLSSIDAMLCDFELGANSTGTAVAEFAQRLFPSTQIVFMSGHRREDVLPHDATVAFLQKPFHPDALLDLLSQRQT